MINSHIYSSRANVFDKIPADLQALPNWVMWKYETVNGKLTKPPFQRNGRKAISTNPDTWVTFEEAVAAFNGSDTFSGIGLCVPIDGSQYIWGFDCDDAIDPETGEFNVWLLDNGELSPVQPIDVLTRINSYSEKTPSGAGFRVIARSAVPVPPRKEINFGKRNPKTGKIPGIEMYSSGRYFTFTGDRMAGTPDTVEDRTAEALSLHAFLFPPSAPKPAGTKPSTSKASVSLDRIETLAMDLIEGRIADSSRNNLIFGISGVLIRAGWKRKDIITLFTYLIFSFNADDAAYEVDVNVSKQTRMLNGMLAKDQADIPSFTSLNEIVTPGTLNILRDLPKPSVVKLSVRETLELIRRQPPSSFVADEIKYLVEPLIPCGSLVLITGKPGSGKSTVVMHWCIEMARAGCEVLYLDRDNPIHVARDREKRFDGLSNMMYWGLWNRHSDGEPLEPPLLDGDFLRDSVVEMKNLVIVLDTLASFATGDENDNSMVAETFKRLRYLTNLGATILVIHHTAKSELSDYRGASAMLGAVDAALKVVGTIEEGKLSRIEIQTFKTRLGDGKPVIYGMRTGVPIRETATITDALRDVLERNSGLSKDAFEKIAVGLNFRRSTIRDFIEKGIVGGIIRYEKAKLYPRSKEADTLLKEAAVLFGDLEDND